MSLLLLSPFAVAQVSHSTEGGGGSITVGAEYSVFRPDSAIRIDSVPQYPVGGHLQGPGFFFDVNLAPKWGAEGEARWLHWGGYTGQTEGNYLIGPRYEAYRRHNLSAWVKLMMGAGTSKFSDFGSGSYFAYAPGATLDYRVDSRWDLRADYEYQFWPSAPGLPAPYDNHGMNPNGFSFGIGYRILRAH